MPVTELVLLHLRPTVTVDSPAVQSSLLFAKQAMESFTGYPFHLYTQVEDPSYIYIIGNWDSLTQHYDQWIPSEKNQALLKSIENLMDLEWMFHVDIDQLATREEGLEGTMPFSAPIIAISRYFMQSDKKGDFLAAFEKSKTYLIEFTAPQPICGGWRIDRDGLDKEEFVLFSGWRDVAHHEQFAQSQGFERYKDVREPLVDFDIKHLTRWDMC